MNTISQLFRQFFPNKTLVHRMSDLTVQLSKTNNDETHISLAIEKSNGTRQFCYFNLDELILLSQKSPLNERAFYEIIFPTDMTKAYIDFEYYTESNLDIQDHHIGIVCCLKIFYSILNFSDYASSQSVSLLDTILNQFLVLEA
ncbi:unnamed protein product [Adineta ricciae]|uniref:Uncharacterized protein n=1 Tax=Adineta ricciae TaxID=249248 RepID=A0A814GX05_ADIRI|nr:unnamed protein product [Adineta ricciae]